MEEGHRLAKWNWKKLNKKQRQKHRFEENKLYSLVHTHCCICRNLYTSSWQCNQYLPNANWIERNRNRLCKFVVIFFFACFLFGLSFAPVSPLHTSGNCHKEQCDQCYGCLFFFKLDCPVSLAIWKWRRAIYIPHRCSCSDRSEMFFALRKWKLNKSHWFRSRALYWRCQVAEDTM